MNSFLSHLLILVLVCIQLAASVDYPHLPKMPDEKAPAEEWDLFWKKLHNYYAIIARPR